MITVKQLMTTPTKSSPDGKHWEPALPEQPSWVWWKISDAWAVWQGKAIAVRKTTKADLGIKEGT